MKRKDVTERKVLTSVKNIIKTTSDISRSQVFSLVAKKLRCNRILIKKICQHNGPILKILSVIPKYYINFAEREKQRKRMIQRYKIPGEREKERKRMINRWNKPGTRKKMSEKMSGENHPGFKKDINMQSIINVIIEITYNVHRQFGKKELYKLIRKELNCSNDVINRRCGDLNDLLQKLGVPIKEKGVGKNNFMYGKPCPHNRSGYYKNIFFRSSWEITVAKLLDDENILWKYENKRFFFNRVTYLPDFYLPEYNLYIEVKGFMNRNPKDAERINLFKQNHKFLLIDNKKYKSLLAGTNLKDLIQTEKTENTI